MSSLSANLKFSEINQHNTFDFQFMKNFNIIFQVIFSVISPSYVDGLN